MNLDEIKNRLASLNNKGGGKKTDYSLNFWKPKEGTKSQVRIVPYKHNKDFPFSELYFYFGIGKPRMIALSNFSESDPILEFATTLKKSGDSENMELAKKLYPKLRVFAPVVVRGEEEKGVRLWGFGITIYKALLALIADEDIGDITDVINGWDLVVEQQQGNPYPETSVRIKPKQTALSDNNDQVETWLKTQPDPSDVHTQYDYDFIKKQLQNHLNPGAAEDTPAKTEAPVKKDFTLETASAGNKDTVSKFDDLFNE